MNIYRLLSIILYVLNFLIIWSLIFRKRERPEKLIGWLLVLTLLPPFGFFLYLLMGVNWKENILSEKFSPDMSEFINNSLKEYNGPYKQITRLVSNSNGSPMFLFNKVTLFKDGVEKFDALLKDLDSAKHHIHMEYYIVKSDAIGRKIFDKLKEKSLEGVKVRVIMDKVGARFFDKKYKKELTDAGVEIVTYTATFAFVSRLIDLSWNYRNHRKIVIIDGRVGYLGGNNIGDEYLGNGKLGYWRDSHMRVEGDFVLGLQGLFFNDFFAVLHRNEHAMKWEIVKRSEVYEREQNFEAYFPKTQVSEYLPMQLAYSGPESPLYTIEMLFIKMITSSKERIYISTPYFIPSEGTMSALKTAIMSGVDVRIMFPAQYDHPYVGHASMTYIGELLECGARVFLYDKTRFAHNKAMVCDSKMFTMGTANFDVRSFFFNYECNAVVYDEYYSSKMEGFYYEDMENSNELTLSEYLNRPRTTFMKESFFRMFSLLF